jgi:hypothetical protein
MFTLAQGSWTAGLFANELYQVISSGTSCAFVSEVVGPRYHFEVDYPNILLSYCFVYFPFLRKRKYDSDITLPCLWSPLTFGSNGPILTTFCMNVT